MPRITRYGVIKPYRFKITLSAVGVTGLTLLSADLQLSLDGTSFTEIGTEVTEIGLGWYQWLPTSAVAQMEVENGIINLKATGGNIGLYDENGGQYDTGGHADAFLDGS